MSGRNLRWLVLGLLAGSGAGLLALTSTMAAAPALAESDLGLVMGPSGVPIPGPDYVQAADMLYLDGPRPPMYPELTWYQATPTNMFGNGLPTPEGLYPITGVNTLPLNFPNNAYGYAPPQTSVGQGVEILNSAIQSNTALGEASTVFGYSQSATVASYAMPLLSPSTPVQFVLVGDPSNPDGGLLSRFPDLTLPSMGVAFGNSTPADLFPTTIYTQEYDGFADFPRYPINFLSDVNAVLGIQDVHGNYLGAIPADGLGPGPAPDVGSAILLPGSALSGTADSMTNYYMIPTNDLPLLDPVRGIPLIGNPIADLLQPDLRLIVNLGYDNPNPLEGWDAGPANVTTPFGLFPSLSQVSAALGQVVPQTELGIQNSIGDFTGGGPNPVTLSSLPSLLDFSSVTSGLSDPLAALSAAASDPTLAFTNAVDTLSSVASTGYGTLLPTADIANAALTSIPAYNVSLFLDNLQAGNLLGAVGLPIAADTGLFTLGGGFEFEVLSAAAQTIATGLMGLIF